MKFLAGSATEDRWAQRTAERWVSQCFETLTRSVRRCDQDEAIPRQVLLIVGGRGGKRAGPGPGGGRLVITQDRAVGDIPSGKTVSAIVMKSVGKSRQRVSQSFQVKKEKNREKEKGRFVDDAVAE